MTTNVDPQRAPILVTGATGNVGRHVVSGLLETGAPVRALTRDPTAAELPDGVQLLQGDLAAPETFATHLEGVDAVFLLWPVDEEAPAFVDAVARHATRITYLSSLGIRDDREQQADPINDSHAEVESVIRRSGLEWTFLRASGFAANALRWAPGLRGDGVAHGPYGAAVRSLIHERDIAAVAVRTLTETGHAGATYALTGPQALTQFEQVQTIGEAVGRDLRYEEIAPEVAREQMIADFPADMVDGILGAHADFVTYPEAVTSTVEELTGTPARTLRAWATEHAESFTS